MVIAEFLRLRCLSVPSSVLATVQGACHVSHRHKITNAIVKLSAHRGNLLLFTGAEIVTSIIGHLLELNSARSEMPGKEVFGFGILFYSSYFMLYYNINYYMCAVHVEFPAIFQAIRTEILSFVFQALFSSGRDAMKKHTISKICFNISILLI